MMKRVLITGGTGFIGRCAMPCLLASAYEVHLVVSRQASLQKIDIDAYVKQGLIVHVCDLLDVQQQDALLATVGATHLLHFAWDVTHGKFWTSEANLRWVQASLQLLKLFRAYGGERVVCAGSCAEYDASYGYCVEELTPMHASTLYGICKSSLNHIFQHYCEQHDISAAWGRVFHLYGPHETASRFVPSVICSMLKQEPVRCSLGNQMRDFMYVEDVADAFVALLDSPVTGDVNIASGEPVTLKHVVEHIAACTNYAGVVEFGAIATPSTEPALLLADVQRLQRDVGYVAKYDLELGMRASIAFWRHHLGG